MDKLIASDRRSLLSIAHEFDLSYDAVRRHAASHVRRWSSVPEREVVVLGWQADGFRSEEEWLASVARQFGLSLDDLIVHCRQNHGNWREQVQEVRG